MTSQRFIHAFVSVCFSLALLTGCSLFSDESAVPASEVQALQAVEDFFQKSLYSLPADWYWSNAAADAEINAERVDADTFSFSVPFALRGDAVDAAKTRAETDSIVDRVITAWERVGWRKEADTPKGYGHRLVSGKASNGLRVDLDITPGMLLARCVVVFDGAAADHDLRSPGMITHDGPKPRAATSAAPTPR